MGSAGAFWGMKMIETRILVVAAAVLALASCNQPQVSHADGSATAAVPGV